MEFEMFPIARPFRGLSFFKLLSLASLLSGCTTYSPDYAVPEVAAAGATIEQVAAEAGLGAPESPIRPDSLANIAVVSNPDLRALRLRAGLADAQLFSAGLLPDPAISLGTDYPQNGANLVTALAAAVSVDLASWITRPLRMDVAEANLANQRYDILWAEWLVRQNAKLLATRIAGLDAIKSKTATLNTLAEADLSRAVQAAARGDLSLVEVNARRLLAADASNRDRAAESQLAAARLDLNRLLGISPDEILTISAPSGPPAASAAMDELFAAALDRRPDLRGLREGLRSGDLGKRLAQAAAYPLPNLAINAGRDTGNLRTLGPAVSFTLPVWNRARGEIRIAKADLAIREAEYLARAEAVRADIGSAVSAIELAVRQRNDVIDDLAGLSAQADRVEAAEARGDLSATSATAIRLAALDKGILADTLALAASEAAIALETALGQPLESIK